MAEAARETAWTRPSFGKELFLGRFRLDLLYPQPHPPAGAVARGESSLNELQRFLVDDVHAERALKDLGTLGMKIDQEYGGLRGP